MSTTTPGHVSAFQAIRSQLYDNISLMSRRSIHSPSEKHLPASCSISRKAVGID